MNIVTSQAAPASASTRPDAAQATLAAGDDAGASQVQGFGALLSKSIADGAAVDGQSATADGPTLGQVLGHEVRAGVDKPFDLRAATARTTQDAADAKDAVDAARNATTADDADAALATTLAAAPSTNDGKVEAAKKATDESSDDAVGTIGSDLAAQLALVSQWAGLAPRAPAVTAAHGATSPDALDIKGKLDAVRGDAARDAAVGPAAAVAVDAASTAAATAALATTAAGALDRQPLSNRAAAASNDRTTRTVAAALSSLSSTTSTATAAPVDAKALDLARAIAPDAQAATVAPLIADLAGHAGSTASSDTSTVSAFLAQVASHLASQAPSQVATGTAVAAPTDALRTDIDARVGSPAWSHEVGQVALRMAANDMQNVSLHLNPEHLGPMEVQVRVDNGVAHLQFAAAHVDTRQALESSRTTLDQMFSDQGIRMGDWSVGQQSSNPAFARDFGGAGQGNGQGSNGTAGQPVGVDTSDATVMTASVRATRPLGLVDTFA